MTDRKKRLLAVSWSLPPLLGPRSIQVGRSLHTLTKLGWHITVLSTDPRSLVLGTQLDEELAVRYLPGLEVLRIPASKLMWLYPLLRRVFPGVGLVPDEQVAWSRKVVDFATDKFSAHDFDALLTFGHPWSDHLIGLALQENLSLGWAAHFSDPWVGNPYNRAYNAHQLQKMKEMEKSVVLAADQLIFTNEPTVNFVLDKYPSLMKRKASVVPHGYDIGFFEDAVVKRRAGASHKLRILHSGNLYGPRSPQGILDALVRLKSEPNILIELEIVFQGYASGVNRWEDFVERNELQNQVKFLRAVSYLDSLTSNAQADVLLVIDAPGVETSIFLPSKLVDYLLFEKPILGLSSTGGVTATFLRSLSMPTANPDDPEAIAIELRKLVIEWKRSQLGIGNSFRNRIRQYDIQSTTKQLEAILLGMISDPDLERGSY